MEILNELNQTTIKLSKRVGRGIGSGRGGHTSGRGAKGDKARGKTKLTSDGTKIKKGWIKRLPFLRGKHRLNKVNNTISFNLEQIEKWYKAKEVVDANTLAKKAKISIKDLKMKIKILSRGELTKSLTFKGILLSEETKKKIISAGGNIE